MTALRVKVGRNPYANRLTCAYCRTEYERGGLWLRLELDGRVVDTPLCGACLDAGHLYEAMVNFAEHNPSHPLRLA